MLTSGVSSSLVNQTSNYFQQRRADMQQLGKDLKAGDLSAAQKDFAAIQSLAQSGPFANGDAFKVSARQQDFASIGQALQSGDLAGAQQAFAQLQATFHHKSVTPSAAPSPDVVVNLGGASSTSSSQPTAAAQSSSDASTAAGPEIVLNLSNMPAGEQITIGVNNSSNGGEQITVSMANPSSQNAEQIVLNLQQNSNQQVILNLFSGSSSSQSQSGSVNVSA